MAAGAAKMDAITGRTGHRRRVTQLGQRQNSPEKHPGGKDGDFNEDEVRRKAESPQMQQMTPVKMRHTRADRASSMRMMNEHFGLPK